MTAIKPLYFDANERYFSSKITSDLTRIEANKWQLQKDRIGVIQGHLIYNSYSKNVCRTNPHVKNPFTSLKCTTKIENILLKYYINTTIIASINNNLYHYCYRTKSIK